MAFFTALVWLVAIGIFIWVGNTVLSPTLSRYKQGSEQGSLIISIFIVSWLCSISVLTGALLSDIYGIQVSDDVLGLLTWWLEMIMYKASPPPGISITEIFFIAGLVALGTCSVIALGYNAHKRGHPCSIKRTALSFGSTASFIIQAIGLVSAILGIMAFYLDFLR